MNSELILKGLVYDVVLKAAVKRIIAAVPFLGYPVINPLFLYLFYKAANIIYAELSLRLDFILIDIKTKAQTEAYEAAVQKLKEAHSAPIIDAKELQNAREKFKRTLGDLIHFNP